MQQGKLSTKELDAIAGKDFKDLMDEHDDQHFSSLPVAAQVQVFLKGKPKPKKKKTLIETPRGEKLFRALSGEQRLAIINSDSNGPAQKSQFFKLLTVEGKVEFLNAEMEGLPKFEETTSDKPADSSQPGGTIPFAPSLDAKADDTESKSTSASQNTEFKSTFTCQFLTETPTKKTEIAKAREERANVLVKLSKEAKSRIVKELAPAQLNNLFNEIRDSVSFDFRKTKALVNFFNDLDLNAQAQVIKQLISSSSPTNKTGKAKKTNSKTLNNEALVKVFLTGINKNESRAAIIKVLVDKNMDLAVEWLNGGFASHTAEIMKALAPSKDTTEDTQGENKKESKQAVKDDKSDEIAVKLFLAIPAQAEKVAAKKESKRISSKKLDDKTKKDVTTPQFDSEKISKKIQILKALPAKTQRKIAGQLDDNELIAILQNRNLPASLALNLVPAAKNQTPEFAAKMIFEVYCREMRGVGTPSTPLLAEKIFHRFTPESQADVFPIILNNDPNLAQHLLNNLSDEKKADLLAALYNPTNIANESKSDLVKPINAAEVKNSGPLTLGTPAEAKTVATSSSDTITSMLSLTAVTAPTPKPAAVRTNLDRAFRLIQGTMSHIGAKIETLNAMQVPKSEDYLKNERNKLAKLLDDNAKLHKPSKERTLAINTKIALIENAIKNEKKDEYNEEADAFFKTQLLVQAYKEPISELSKKVPEKKEDKKHALLTIGKNKVQSKTKSKCCPKVIGLPEELVVDGLVKDQEELADLFNTTRLGSGTLKHLENRDKIFRNFMLTNPGFAIAILNHSDYFGSGETLLKSFVEEIDPSDANSNGMKALAHVLTHLSPKAQIKYVEYLNSLNEHILDFLIKQHPALIKNVLENSDGKKLLEGFAKNIKAEDKEDQKNTENLQALATVLNTLTKKDQIKYVSYLGMLNESVFDHLMQNHPKLVAVVLEDTNYFGDGKKLLQRFVAEMKSYDANDPNMIALSKVLLLDELSPKAKLRYVQQLDGIDLDIVDNLPDFTRPKPEKTCWSSLNCGFLSKKNLPGSKDQGSMSESLLTGNEEKSDTPDSPTAKSGDKTVAVTVVAESKHNNGTSNPTVVNTNSVLASNSAGSTVSGSSGSTVSVNVGNSQPDTNPVVLASTAPATKAGTDSTVVPVQVAALKL